MKRIVFHYTVGYAGMDGIDFLEYDDDVTDAQLDEDAWVGAMQHAEAYGVYDAESAASDPDITDEELDSDSYSYGIEGWWEIYDPEKHDGLVPGGGPAYPGDE